MECARARLAVNKFAAFFAQVANVAADLGLAADAGEVPVSVERL
jgi:hypothetical protein